MGQWQDATDEERQLAQESDCAFYEVFPTGWRGYATPFGDAWDGGGATCHLLASHDFNADASDHPYLLCRGQKTQCPVPCKRERAL